MYLSPEWYQSFEEPEPEPEPPVTEATVGEKALYLLNDSSEWKKLMEHLRGSGISTNAAARLMIIDYLDSKQKQNAKIDDTQPCPTARKRDECRRTILETTIQILPECIKNTCVALSREHSLLSNEIPPSNASTRHSSMIIHAGRSSRNIRCRSNSIS